jgi:hydantoinase/carbamoylase family amidase
MVASGVWAEEIPLDRAHNLQEVGSGTATMKSELERIGYLGSVPASYRSIPIAAHFELHIEQGPILEAEKRKIGVVEGVQAYRWFTIDVTGRGKVQVHCQPLHDVADPSLDAHTGTTPFSSRADALLLAARMITHSHEVAVKHSALASTGILTLSPGSVNTIPGHVRFSLDIRAPADSTVDTVEAELRKDFASLAASNSKLSVDWQTDSVSPAVNFHPDCIAAVQAAAEAVTGNADLVRDMVSGAGHDSVYASRRCPTSMIFVPCRNGVSHNPEEYTSPEDCAIGAEVLMQSVLRYDRLRAERASS